jgi:hypothetical protein
MFSIALNPRYGLQLRSEILYSGFSLLPISLLMTFCPPLAHLSSVLDFV